jgi:hypothetical protein
LGGVKAHGGDRSPLKQRRRRRQKGHWQSVRYAEHAQGAIVPGMAWIRRSRWCSVIGVTDRSIADWIGAEAQRRLRDSGKENDLAPDGNQRRGKPYRAFQPLERNDRVALPHKTHPTCLSGTSNPLDCRRQAGRLYPPECRRIQCHEWYIGKDHSHLERQRGAMAESGHIYA